jgi:hypothetical protein
MSRTWEYAQLHLSYDPGAADASIYGWLALPDDDEWQKLGKVEKLRALINRLGSEGWEMVGGPSSQNSVFTYQAGNDTWHDRAYWVERDFWFKREAGV